MNRRSDPDRLAAARLAGLRSRLIDAWTMTPEAADALLQAWSVEAEKRDLSPRTALFWAAGEEWLSRRRSQ